MLRIDRYTHRPEKYVTTTAVEPHPIITISCTYCRNWKSVLDSKPLNVTLAGLKKMAFTAQLNHDHWCKWATCIGNPDSYEGKRQLRREAVWERQAARAAAAAAEAEKNKAELKVELREQ
jgi:hypothetical protein